jgi:hypothetical protein
VQVYFDIALGLFLQSPGSNNEITQITAKRASNNPISLQFLTNGVVTTLPVGTSFIFGAKQIFNSQGPNAYYDANYIVYAPNTMWSGPDSNNNYTCNPGYNTTQLNTLFGYTYPNVDNNPQPDYVNLVGEISWLLPGQTLYNKTGYWTIKVYNDISKGIEGVPTSGGPVYPDPTQIQLISAKGSAGGYAGLDSNALVPKVNLPPLIYNYSNLTMLTGSSATTLDGISTANGATPRNFALMAFDIGYGTSTIPGASLWRLEAGTAAASPGLIVPPADYNLSTNANVWIRKA